MDLRIHGSERGEHRRGAVRLGRSQVADNMYPVTSLLLRYVRRTGLEVFSSAFFRTTIRLSVAWFVPAARSLVVYASRVHNVGCCMGAFTSRERRKIIAIYKQG